VLLNHNRHPLVLKRENSQLLRFPSGVHLNKVYSTAAGGTPTEPTRSLLNISKYTLNVTALALNLQMPNSISTDVLYQTWPKSENKCGKYGLCNVNQHNMTSTAPC